jgi:hypothetical protein
MSRFAIWAAVLATAMLLSGAAQAMEIEKFDRMAAQDQSDYIVVLIEGAQKVLVQSGRKDLADKVRKLFTETFPGDDSPLGAVEFERNLARARVADLRNLEKEPRADRLECVDGSTTASNFCRKLSGAVDPQMPNLLRSLLTHLPLDGGGRRKATGKTR